MHFVVDGVNDVIGARRSRSALSSDGDVLYWIESRPEEGGRQVLVRGADDASGVEVSPVGMSIRTRVHEYGGGAYCLLTGAPQPSVAVVNDTDGRIWHVPWADGSSVESTAPVPVSPTPPPGIMWRFADLVPLRAGRWIAAVREEHREDKACPRRSLIAVEVAAPHRLVTMREGTDFYAAPRPDRGDAHLAWIEWERPDMPWDASSVWVADLCWDGADGVPICGKPIWVAGGRIPTPISVGQPLWCRDGSLVYISDQGGWWRPWRAALRADGTVGLPIGPLCPEEAEFHTPDWVLGQTTIVELPSGDLYCRRRSQGRDDLGRIPAGGGPFQPVDQPCVSIPVVCAHGDGVAWLGATWEEPLAPWSREIETLPFAASDPAPGSPSRSSHLTFPGGTGLPIHARFHPARSRRQGDDRPPLVIICHGGPTASAEPGFDPLIGLLTSRGIAVAAVDYGGSTGYGRAYRDRLHRAWGIVDVEDCLAAARYLVSERLVDPDRIAFRGTSAGGFTALRALEYPDLVCAAVAWYPVTDLEGLAAHTHDFEGGYNQWLVGPYPAAQDEYRARSPLRRVERVHAGSLLLLQGETDPVVPAGQTASYVQALGARGIQPTYRSFPGEGHGFRRSDTLRIAYEAELQFYEDVFARR